MSRFAILALCVLASLIQISLSQQCGCGRGSYGSCGFGGLEKVSVSAPRISVSKSSGGSSSYGASYGGTGTGRVGVTGDIDACGQTCVVGSVPVTGSVEFGGCVPACGSVSICGQCGCGCN